MAYKKKNPKSGTGYKKSNKHRVSEFVPAVYKKIKYEKIKEHDWSGMTELEFIGDVVRKKSVTTKNAATHKNNKKSNQK
tara:strand:+ start:629 stop:865 length:237 start_codon:yes stop_codon:yes gene_type:complete